jgi:hypothetical protein
MPRSYPSIPPQVHYVGGKEIAMTGFWIAIVLVTLAIVGVSVVVGKTLGRPKGAASSDRQAQMTALKASGALKYRKSNRN